MRHPRRLVAAVGGAALLAGGLGLVAALPLAAARKGMVHRFVAAPGIVEALSGTVALSFEAPGRIVEIGVREGDRVATGQVLARLDGRLASARVAQAEAALAIASARRDAVLHGMRKAEVRALQAEVDAARAQLRERTRVVSRSEKLSTAGAVGEADAQQAREGATVAKAALDSAVAHLQVAHEGSRAEARAEALAAVEAAEAELRQAHTALEQTELRSPLTGTVVGRFADLGQQVVPTPPTEVLTVGDLDRLQVRAEVDESDVARVRIGQRGFATADAYGDRQFPGRVVNVAHALGRRKVPNLSPDAKADTRVLEVVLELDRGFGLPVGLRMDVRIETERRTGVLTVPLRGIRWSDGAPYVLLLHAVIPIARSVRLGLDDGVVAEVQAGLVEGDRVLLR